jgi:hypothetical protein
MLQRCEWALHQRSHRPCHRHEGDKARGSAKPTMKSSSRDTHAVPSLRLVSEHSDGTAPNHYHLWVLLSAVSNQFWSLLAVSCLEVESLSRRLQDFIDRDNIYLYFEDFFIFTLFYFRHLGFIRPVHVSPVRNSTGLKNKHIFPSWLIWFIFNLRRKIKRV